MKNSNTKKIFIYASLVVYLLALTRYFIYAEPIRFIEFFASTSILALSIIVLLNIKIFVKVENFLFYSIRYKNPVQIDLDDLWEPYVVFLNLLFGTGVFVGAVFLFFCAQT